jgi:hypothetical protein
MFHAKINTVIPAAQDEFSHKICRTARGLSERHAKPEKTFGVHLSNTSFYEKNVRRRSQSFCIVRFSLRVAKCGHNIGVSLGVNPSLYLGMENLSCSAKRLYCFNESFLRQMFVVSGHDKSNAEILVCS